MEVAQHCVAPPPPDDLYRVQVDSCREDFHPPPRSERAHDNVLWCEPNGWGRFADDDVYGGRDLGAANHYPLVFVAQGSKRSCASGAVASKICDASTQFCHWKALGVASSVVADVFSLGAIFLFSEEEAYEFGTGLRGQACGGQVLIERMLANEELEVLEEEKLVFSVGAAPAVLFWTEEKE